MNSKSHVKKGDIVLVLTGKDGGNKGKILEVLPKDQKVLVEGINMNTKHKKPRGMNQQGGLIKQENYIHISNVMYICSHCKQPTKLQRSIAEDGTKSRICKKCKEVIDVISDKSKEE